MAGGGLAYRLIVGDPPGGTPAEALRANLLRRLRPTHHADALADWIMAMLDPDPALRPLLAGEWASRLELAERSARRPERIWLRARNVGLVAVVALAGVGGYLAHPAGRPSTPSASEASARGPTFLPLDSRLTPGPTPESHPVTVYNKVTNGASAMREDVPAYLSTKIQDYCALDGCEIPGTDMGTGTMLTATCQTEGEITTNGNNTNNVDAHNPGRFTSSLWYGIRLPNHVFGYLSAVWVAPDDRGGFALPQC